MQGLTPRRKALPLALRRAPAERMLPQEGWPLGPDRWERRGLEQEWLPPLQALRPYCQA